MSYCKITGEYPCKCKHISSKVIVDYDDVKLALRKVFSEHSWYTILAIYESVPIKQPDSGIIVERLLKNPRDIANLLLPIIGKVKADNLEEAVKDHLVLANAALTAINSKGNVPAAVGEFYKQGDQFAQALTDINPGALPFDVTSKMIRQHNEFVVNMASNRAGSKFQESVALIDPYYAHMLMLSDTLCNALPRM